MTNDEARMTKEARMTNDQGPRPDALAEFRQREKREENLRKGGEQLRQLAADQGRDWEKMSDDERIALVDDLMHEDRGFSSGQDFNG